MLDKERYLALGVDVLEHELREGEELSSSLFSLSLHEFTLSLPPIHVAAEETKKRQREQKGGYQAVGFAYKESLAAPPEAAMGTNSLPLPPRRPEHPLTSTVDVATSEAERFVTPAGLDVPGHIQQVQDMCMHHRGFG